MDAKEVFEDCSDFDNVEISVDNYDSNAAKERSSLLWLLSKAFVGNIPNEIREPFYRDCDGCRRLKPRIVHSLANAELYCLALSNTYQDPNYRNLDHHGILQVITRRGVTLVHSGDTPPPTETVLVQTAPIKLGSHLTVIEGIISMYIKDILIPEKIVTVVKHLSSANTNIDVPSTAEEAAILWINKCCISLEQEIREQFQSEESQSKLPKIPVLQEIADIRDGCCLAAVISFYCPDHLNWQNVCWNDPMSLGDSIYNLQMVRDFCCDNLPRHVAFLTLDDFLNIHYLLKNNILLFIAELLFSFVISPPKCVTRFQQRGNAQSQNEGKSKGNSIPAHRAHQLSCNAIPNLRADSYGGSTSSLPELRPGFGTSPTSKEPLERSNSGKKVNPSIERLRMSPRLQRTSSSGTVNGHKSASGFISGSIDGELRRNNITNRDGLHSAIDITKCSSGIIQSSEDRPTGALSNFYRSLATNEAPQRAGSLSCIQRNENWKKSTCTERPSLKSSTSSQSSGICMSETDKLLPSKTSFAKLSQEPEGKSQGINIIYSQHEKDKTSPDGAPKAKSEKHATFAALPNTTTWQQQKALSSSSSQADSGHETPVESSDPSLKLQLANLRLKLEDKRRKIETEKKRMETLHKRQRQKLGKLAFLQAVSRGGGGAEAETPDSGTGKDDDEIELPPVMDISREVMNRSPSLVRRMSIQDIAEDLDSVQRKWLENSEILLAGHGLVDSLVECEVTENFEASIEQLNSSLCDLQADISRITFQQEHMENLMQDSVEDASHFFLHDAPYSASNVQESPKRIYQWCKPTSSSYNTQQGNIPVFLAEFPSLSPQRHPYHSQHFMDRQVSLDESVLPSTAPKTRDHRQAEVDELYSKVVKPTHRQKTKSLGQFSLPGEPSADKNFRLMQQQQQNAESASSLTGHRSRVQVQQPQTFSPRHHQGEKLLTNGSPQKKVTADGDRGFCVTYNDQANRSTTQWQRPQQETKPQQDNFADKDDESAFGFVIGADLVHPDPDTEIEMAKKKELILNMSIRRRAEHDNRKLVKEQEYTRLKEDEQKRKDTLEKKREDERLKRQSILDTYRQRKLQDEMEKEGQDFSSGSRAQMPIKSRSRNRVTGKPRPKSSFITTGETVDCGVANKRNSQFIGKGLPDFDLDSLNSAATSASSRDRTRSPTNNHYEMSPSDHSGDGSSRQMDRGGTSSDGASDTTSNSSNAAVMMEYTGPKLFVKPTSKSNRGIIINAINTVLAGVVNCELKKKVLEEINKSESKHFLILFRDSGCQFRAVYSYNPDTAEVNKLHGIGPKSVCDSAMEKFYKYNSGGKCFSAVHTKHLTVTIDAFTIPNNLWVSRKATARKDLL